MKTLFVRILIMAGLALSAAASYAAATEFVIRTARGLKAFCQKAP